MKNFIQIWMKMQNWTLPKFEISIFEKFGFGKMTKSHLTIMTKSHLTKNAKSAPENLILNFGAGKLISKII